jgi:hypothetical protein
MVGSFSARMGRNAWMASRGKLQDIGKICHFVEFAAVVTGLSSNAVMLRLPRHPTQRGSDAGRLSGGVDSKEPDRPRPFGVPPTEK